MPVAPLSAAGPPRRVRCPHCALPLPTCCCAQVVPTLNRLPVLVLQHPGEVHQAKGSVRLLRLGLSQCVVRVGEQFEPALLAAWLRGAEAPCEPGDGRQARLLYPSDGTPAPPLSGDGLAAGVGMGAEGIRLVLIDATWRQSRQMLRRHPLLQALPRYGLQAPPPSRYAARTAQAAHQRSSLEACCLALGELEGDPARYAPMLTAFEGWAEGLARRFKRS